MQGVQGDDQDDDDSWMVVEPQYIDQLLTDHMQASNLRDSERSTVDNIAESISQFVHKVSWKFLPFYLFIN